MLNNLLKKQGLVNENFELSLSGYEALSFLESILSSDSKSKLNLLIQTTKLVNQIDNLSFDVSVKEAFIDKDGNINIDTDEMISEIKVSLSTGEEIILENSVINKSYDYRIEETLQEELNNGKELSIDDLRDEDIEDLDEVNSILNFVKNKKLRFKDSADKVESVLFSKVVTSYNIVSILNQVNEELFNKMLVSKIELIESLDLENVRELLLNKKISIENKESLLKNCYIPKYSQKYSCSLISSEEELEDMELSNDEIFYKILVGNIQLIDKEKLAIDNQLLLNNFLSNNKISTSSIVKALKEEKNFPINLVCEKNDIDLFSEKDVLLFLNNEDILEENKEKIVDTYQKNLIKEGLSVTGIISLENFNLLIDKSIDPDSIVIDLLNEQLNVKENSLKDSLNIIVGSTKLSEKTISNLLSKESFFVENLNEVIINNELIIVNDNIKLVRIGNYKEITKEAVSTLENRYFLINGNEEIELEQSKVKQLELVDHYKKMIEGEIELPIGNESDLIINDLNLLLKYAEKYDDSKVKGFTLNNVIVEGLSFDSDGYEIIESHELTRLMFNILDKNPSGNFVQYVYDFEGIELEFKMPGILKAEQCPFKIRKLFYDDPNFLYFLLDNPTLSGDRIKNMAHATLQVGEGTFISKIYDKMLRHPNCPVESIKFIFNGVIKLAEKIKETSDSDFLYSSFLNVASYPNRKAYEFDITNEQKVDLFEIIVKNKNTPSSVLKYYLEIMGDDNEKVIEEVISHSNVNEFLIGDIILNNYSSVISGKKIVEKNISFEESVDVAKYVLSKLNLSVNTDLPISLVYLMNNIKEIQAELESDELSIEEGTIFDELKEITQIYQKELYSKKYNELFSIASNSKNTENINKVIRILEEENTFYDGLFSIKADDVLKIMTRVVTNPQISINENSRLIEKYDLR